MLYVIGFRQEHFSQLIYNVSMLGISLFAGYHGLIQKDLAKEADMALALDDTDAYSGTGNTLSSGIQNIVEGTDSKEGITLEKIYSVIKTEILPQDISQLSPAEKHSKS
jgi:hypothetical protein